MELELNERSFPYLDRVFQQVLHQEETGETIVPDTYPDISQIVHAYAEPIIRGKDIRDKSIVVSGGVKGGVIYVPDDRSVPRELSFYLPFTAKFDSPVLTEQAQVICSCKICAVDGKIVNSRKAMLRVDLGCSVTAYEQAQSYIYEPVDKPDGLQLREKEYALQMPVELSEKTFMISDTLELPSSSPPIHCVCKRGCQFEILDHKLVGNKGVFKGNATVKLLYLSEDDRLYTYEWQLPFSQYCEFVNDYDRGAMELDTVMTGYELELTSPEDHYKLDLSLHMLVQGLAIVERELKVIDDAYCVGQELHPEWKRYTMDICLDSRLDRQTLRHRIDRHMNELVDTDLYVGYPRVDRADDQIRVISEAHIHILGLDENGELAEAVTKVEDVQPFASSERAIVTANTDSTATVNISLFPDSIQLACDILRSVSFHAQKDIRTLCAGTLDSLEFDGHEQPSIIIKNVPENTDLWDLAKAHHSRIDTICAVNDLIEPVLEKEQVLLIPVG